MSEPLCHMFDEKLDQVLVRERTALANLLAQTDNRVVLFGAGTLGRRALPLLHSLGVTVQAFADNNEGVWGGHIDGIPVRPPAQAALEYGTNALFLVSIWNSHHWFGETHAQLSRLGCNAISTYAPLFWRFPTSFLDLYLLNELPHRVYGEQSDVLAAETVWADEESLDTYRANIRWRALGDALDLPGRPTCNTYFPEELFRLSDGDVALDCGAFDGDTIRQLLDVTGGHIAGINAIEPDSMSFENLQKYVASVDASAQLRIHTYPCAIGDKRGTVLFESTGAVTSKVSGHGVPVQVHTIDDLFGGSDITFIKMDIEGSEYGALLGARSLLERNQPILAICVYHTQSDIWRIPLLIHAILPRHRLFLRAYEGDGFQTVVYAVPEERLAGSAV